MGFTLDKKTIGMKITSVLLSMFMVIGVAGQAFGAEATTELDNNATVTSRRGGHFQSYAAGIGAKFLHCCSRN
mgnify:CR=1 FL=1